MDLAAKLHDVATGKVGHLYAGRCPDLVEGTDVRDVECPACRVIMAADLLFDSAHGHSCMAIGVDAHDGGEKDYGPLELGGMLGMTIGGYHGRGVTRDELLELVGSIYDHVERAAAKYRTTRGNPSSS